MNRRAYLAWTGLGHILSKAKLCLKSNLLRLLPSCPYVQLDGLGIKVRGVYRKRCTQYNWIYQNREPSKPCLLKPRSSFSETPWKDTPGCSLGPWSTLTPGTHCQSWQHLSLICTIYCFAPNKTTLLLLCMCVSPYINSLYVRSWT